MRKQLIRSTVFILIPVLLLSLTSLLFQRNTLSDTDPKIMWEPDNTLDVVFIGDSMASTAFVPAQIWENYGFTTFACGTPVQRLYKTENMLRVIFRKQHPGILFLETDLLYTEFPWTEALLPNISMLFSVIDSHDDWKPERLKYWFVPAEESVRDWGKGYYCRLDSDPADASGYMAPTDECYDISQRNLKYLKRILSLCRENDAELILISAPSTMNWDTACHNCAVRLADTLGIRYIDTNLLTEQIPIDWETDTYDKGDHMNLFGATKVTAYIGSYLAENFPLEDKREHPDYDFWNTSLRDFYRNVDELALKESGED